ncbi:uncharacterized protein LOC111292934 isoform X2 [Durio zibethinus]|uniref:U5 small nuclear ribonucleoprotein TSSC4 n=1 Tax=Durio zibethinus TaxID=66656 RepID=A0A6P5YMM4_DURZI|nr:uncharacterized protein LOC111292934 isoform X2 [Durio zibethinus]
MEMELVDRFNVRVDKAFGSLASSSSSSSSNSKSQSLSSLWRLTDDEIAKREWNGDKEGPQPEEGFCDNFPQKNKKKKAINFRAELEKDLDDLDDEDLEEEEACVWSSKGGKPEDYNDEEWEIKSSIGRDRTLDYEEEEDEYDKVAVGREKTRDCLYIKDINDYEIDADSCNMLPTAFKDFSRDPRANNIAAKLRLKEDEEDAEAAIKIHSLRVSDSDATVGVDTHISTFEEEMIAVKGLKEPKMSQGKLARQRKKKLWSSMMRLLYLRIILLEFQIICVTLQNILDILLIQVMLMMNQIGKPTWTF